MVLDEFYAHVHEDVKGVARRKGFVPTVMPASATGILQPLGLFRPQGRLPIVLSGFSAAGCQTGGGRARGRHGTLQTLNGELQGCDATPQERRTARGSVRWHAERIPGGCRWLTFDAAKVVSLVCLCAYLHATHAHMRTK